MLSLDRPLGYLNGINDLVSQLLRRNAVVERLFSGNRSVDQLASRNALVADMLVYDGGTCNFLLGYTMVRQLRGNDGKIYDERSCNRVQLDFLPADRPVGNLLLRNRRIGNIIGIDKRSLLYRELTGSDCFLFGLASGSEVISGRETGSGTELLHQLSRGGTRFFFFFHLAPGKCNVGLFNRVLRHDDIIGWRLYFMFIQIIQETKLIDVT